MDTPVTNVGFLGLITQDIFGPLASNRNANKLKS